MTERFQGQAGHLTALIGREVEVKTSQGRSEFMPIGEEIEIPCDVVFLALGFSGPDLTSLQRDLDLKVSARGHLEIDHKGRCPDLPLYVAGDAKRGSSLIVWALSDGIEVARAIDEELSQTSALVQ